MSRGVRNALYGLGSVGSSFLDAFLRARQQAQENERWTKDYELRKQQVENHGWLQGEKRAQAENQASKIDLAQRGVGGFDRYGRAVVPPVRERQMAREDIAREQRIGPFSGQEAAREPLDPEQSLSYEAGERGPFGTARATEADVETPFGQALATEREKAFESRRKPVQKGIEAIPEKATKSAAEVRLAGLPVEAQQLAMQHGTAEGGTLRKMMDRARELARTEAVLKAAKTTAVREAEKTKALRTKNMALDLGAQEKAGQLIRPLAPGAPEPILPAPQRKGAQLSPEEFGAREFQKADWQHVRKVMALTAQGKDIPMASAEAAIQTVMKQKGIDHSTAAAFLGLTRENIVE